MIKPNVKSMCTDAPINGSVCDEKDEKSDRMGISDDVELEEEDETLLYGEGAAHEIVENDSAFKPIYSIGYWNDPDDNDSPCASVAILSFTGVDKISDFSINIVGDSFIEYKVVWPEQMTVSTILHRMWLEGKGRRSKLAEYHGMVKCFEKMMGPLRRHDNRIETTARIPINMKVESRASTHLLAFPGTTAKVIYIILRGPARKVTNLDDQAISWEK